MRFSVIVTAHNSEGYIRKALDSIKEQTFTDYELIVVCNDCQDNTKAVALEYTARVFECCHRNCSMTHNVGLDNAWGDYVLFVHDDDWWLHQFVLEMLDSQITSEDVLAFGFVFGRYGFKRPLDNGGLLYPALWSKAWRRSTIGETRVPDIDGPGEDLEFTKLVLAGDQVITIFNEPLYFYNYLRPGSYSAAHNSTG